MTAASSMAEVIIAQDLIVQDLAAAGFGPVASDERFQIEAQEQRARAEAAEAQVAAARDVLAWIKAAASDGWAAHNEAADMRDFDAANHDGGVAEALDEVASRLHAALDADA